MPTPYQVARAEEAVVSERANGYTQGPWVLDPETCGHVIGDGYHVIEAGEGSHPFFDRETDSGFHIATYMSDGDARLIALAPEMVEALRQWKRLLAEHEDEVRIQARELWATIAVGDLMERTDALLARLDGEEARAS